MCSDPSAAPPPGAARVMSIDALRGFTMFWIIGAEHLARALRSTDHGPVVTLLTDQMTHVRWAGLHCFDVIFPMFLFLVGVAIVYSIDRVRQQQGRAAVIRRILVRTVLLFLLGIFYYGGIASGWAQVQWAGVLHRIALCYGLAATLYVLGGARGAAVGAVLCLVGYWALLTFVPIPDLPLNRESVLAVAARIQSDSPAAIAAAVPERIQGSYVEGRNVAHYVDFRWLPGRKRDTYYTNEGLLSTIPAVATTLLGILAGLMLKRGAVSPRGKVLLLFAGGIAAIAIGAAWGGSFPVIKRLWTSSFVLVTAGVSAIALGFFHAIIDVGRCWRWTIPLLWIGSNSIVAYLAVNLVDFRAIAARLVGGGLKDALDAAHAGTGTLLVALTALILPIALLGFLHHNNLKVRL